MSKSVAFSNADELVKFFQEHQDAVHQLITLKSEAPKAADPEHATDALGQRDVVAQAHKEAVAAPTTSAGPSTAPKPVLPKFAAKGTEARNTIRLVNGPDNLFTSVTRFGANTYVPDFRLNHRLLHDANRIIIANKRFYDSSEFFHPLIAHIYLGVLEHVQVMRVMRTVSALSTEQSDFLEWFESTYNYEALSVPGFLRNQLVCLGSSSPAMHSYNNVYPVLPPTPQSSDHTLGVISMAADDDDASTYGYRLAPILPLLSQLQSLLNNATAQGATPATVTNWIDFGTTIFGWNSFGTQANGQPVHPATARAQTNLRADASQTAQCLFGAPGFETFSNPTRNVATTFLDYAADLDSIMPRVPATNTSLIENTWRSHLAMDLSHEWFTQMARIMSFYSQFFKDATNMGAISPIGSTSGQIMFTQITPAANRPQTRYPVHAIISRGSIVNLAISEADALDAATCMLNQSADYPVNDEPRSGPFFNDLPVLKRSRELNPHQGYGQVLTDYYRLSNAEQPVLL